MAVDSSRSVLKLTCDRPEEGCGNEWEISDADTKQEKMGNGDIRFYIECPTCRIRYSVCYTNTKIRKLQKQLRESLQQPLGNQIRISVLRNRIKVQMNELREKYEGQ